MTENDIQARIHYSGYQDPGFAATYATRPSTPPVAIEIIFELAASTGPRPWLWAYRKWLAVR